MALILDVDLNGVPLMKKEGLWVWGAGVEAGAVLTGLEGGHGKLAAWRGAGGASWLEGGLAREAAATPAETRLASGRAPGLSTDRPARARLLDACQQTNHILSRLKVSNFEFSISYLSSASQADNKWGTRLSTSTNKI